MRPGAKVGYKLGLIDRIREEVVDVSSIEEKISLVKSSGVWLEDEKNYPQEARSKQRLIFSKGWISGIRTLRAKGCSRNDR